MPRVFADGFQLGRSGQQLFDAVERRGQHGIIKAPLFPADTNLDTIAIAFDRLHSRAQMYFAAASFDVIRSGSV